ncbi:hypothetical protein KUTeg_006778 [Tegillarca granosa]|uniref:Uncharacterized protein n=1 Tax=Tegillarca granosa TaxID=220873 RepID=A0ABQ9FBB3_TEGGR|nr:hypothetical protein KUTeg_006778 [Tegillarca granosa]
MCSVDSDSCLSQYVNDFRIQEFGYGFRRKPRISCFQRLIFVWCTAGSNSYQHSRISYPCRDHVYVG